MALPIAKIKATAVMRQNNPLPGAFAPIPCSQWVDCVTTGAAAVNYTIPANISVIRLTSSAVGLPSYGSLTGTAAVPVASTTGNQSFPIPAGLMLSVEPGAVLSIVAAAAAIMVIEGWT